MAGLVAPDEGTRFLRPGLTAGYMAQDPDFAGFATLGAFVEAGGRSGRALARRDRDGGRQARRQPRSGGGLGRRAAARGAGADPRRGPGPDAARRADQPPRRHRHRLAGAVPDRDARGGRRHQPRPGVPARADRPHPLGRPRRRAPARPGLRRLRGMARQDLRGRGPRAPQARPADQGRGALGGRGHLRPAQAQPGPGAPSGGDARRTRRADRPDRHGEDGVRQRLALGQAGARGDRRRQVLRRARDRPRLLAPGAARRAHRAGRPERRRQDHAAEDPHRRAGARRRNRAAGDEPQPGSVRPEPRRARRKRQPLGHADRRRHASASRGATTR